MSDLRKLAASVLARKSGTGVGKSVEQTEQGAMFQKAFPVPQALERSYSQKSGKNVSCSTVPVSRGGTRGTWPRLLSLPCPFNVDPNAWRLVLRDGERLIAEGWADRAIALGWTALDLFGASDDVASGDGLAVWLQGRKLRAMCATWAVAHDLNGNRFYFNRPRDEGAVLLWKLGRGR